MRIVAFIKHIIIQKLTEFICEFILHNKELKLIGKSVQNHHSLTVLFFLNSPAAGDSIQKKSHYGLGLLLAPVVQRLDNAIHRINHYPADRVVCFVNTYPLDSDLSGG